jgi:hypothetical protein
MENVKAVFLVLRDNSVDGRGPMLPYAIFDSEELADTHMATKATAGHYNIKPMPLITKEVLGDMALYEELGDMALYEEKEAALLAQQKAINTKVAMVKNILTIT